MNSCGIASKSLTCTTFIPRWRGSEKSVDNVVCAVAYPCGPGAAHADLPQKE